MSEKCPVGFDMNNHLVGFLLRCAYLELDAAQMKCPKDLYMLKYTNTKSYYNSKANDKYVAFVNKNNVFAIVTFCLRKPILKY